MCLIDCSDFIFFKFLSIILNDLILHIFAVIFGYSTELSTNFVDLLARYRRAVSMQMGVRWRRAWPVAAPSRPFNMTPPLGARCPSTLLSSIMQQIFPDSPRIIAPTQL